MSKPSKLRCEVCGHEGRNPVALGQHVKTEHGIDASADARMHLANRKPRRNR